MPYTRLWACAIPTGLQEAFKEVGYRVVLGMLGEAWAFIMPLYSFSEARVRSTVIPFALFVYEANFRRIYKVQAAIDTT